MISSTLYHSVSEDPYAQVVSFLNNETPTNALIETYDSELFLLLERDYHYPPDALQHKLNQKKYLNREVSIDYDPTVEGIDCVAIGWTKMWPLYDDLLEDDTFELVYENAIYRVFCETEN